MTHFLSTEQASYKQRRTEQAMAIKKARRADPNYHYVCELCGGHYIYDSWCVHKNSAKHQRISKEMELRKENAEAVRQMRNLMFKFQELITNDHFDNSKITAQDKKQFIKDIDTYYENLDDITKQIQLEIITRQ